MREATGFVTAGGRSSRMGRDKAWLDFGGRPILECVVDALSPVCASVAVIANGAEYQHFGLPVFHDTNAGVGPLEAIRIALTRSRTPFAVVVGCDLPFVTSELFALLLSVPGDWQAIVPLAEGGTIEPLCAVYSVEAQVVVTNLIDEGERKAAALLDLVPTRLVAFDELRHLDCAESFFENVNTPDDYSRALRRLSSSVPDSSDPA